MTEGRAGAPAHKGGTEKPYVLKALLRHWTKFLGGVASGRWLKAELRALMCPREKKKNHVLKFAKRNLTPTTAAFHRLKIHSPTGLIFPHILLPFNCSLMHVAGEVLTWESLQAFTSALQPLSGRVLYNDVRNFTPNLLIIIKISSLWIIIITIHQKYCQIPFRLMMFN